MIKTYKGNIVLKNKILFGGYVSIENGKIISVSETCPNFNFEDCQGNYILPGFIDVHCHGGQGALGHEDIEKVSAYHKSHGTTTMLISFYRNIPHETILKSLFDIKRLSKTLTNIYGAHLEGPYLNSSLGANIGNKQDNQPNSLLYNEYIKTGVVKSWTCSPEVCGVLDFIKDVKEKAPEIVIGIGHSTASFPVIKSARDSGASLITHIFDATGYTPYSNPYYVGTKDLDFDLSAMYLDGFYYEVIFDKNHAHVRKEMLEILIKLKGKDKVIFITDYLCEDKNAPETDEDINVINGELSGSKLTMDKVAKNLFNAGYNFVDIAKFTALNASKCFSMKDRGEIKVGKRADMVILNDKAELIGVIC